MGNYNLHKEEGQSPEKKRREAPGELVPPRKKRKKREKNFMFRPTEITEEKGAPSLQYISASEKEKEKFSLEGRERKLYGASGEKVVFHLLL